MTDSDNDEELKRAITLSLQEPVTESNVITIDSDSEKSIAANAHSKDVEKDQMVRQNLSSMMGLNRKQMEEEVCIIVALISIT